MRVREYLPSMQLSLLFASVCVAGGLVFAAHTITTPATQSATNTDAVSVASSTNAAALQHANWEATLYEIQAQQGSSTLPTPANPATVDGLRQAAQSSNMTDTIARTLLVNLANAKTQGLGDDIPTQNQLITTAVEQASIGQAATEYTLRDLIIVADSPATLRAYGNALATTHSPNAANDIRDTFVAIDNATAQNNPDLLAPLKKVAKDYQTMEQLLLAVPVPQTLAPFHLQLINNFSKIANTYPDMENLIVDPVRGLNAIQQYKSLSDGTLNVFINIARAFNKDGILFSKDEPGASWGVLLSAQQ